MRSDRGARHDRERKRRGEARGLTESGVANPLRIAPVAVEKDAGLCLPLNLMS